MARTLRICLVSEEFPPETGWGGIGTYAYVLATGLARLGHRVHVIARGWGADTVTEVEGVVVHRLTIDEPSWRRGTIRLTLRFVETRQIVRWTLRVAAAVCRIAAREGLDVVESPEYHAQGLATAVRLRRVPVVVKLHSPAYMMNRVNQAPVGGSPWDTRLSEGLERALARRARLVTSPSRSLADDVARHWRLDRPAVGVVPNPIDHRGFAAAEAGSGGCDLVYVGRIERRKGVETLLEAMPAILAERPEARLRMVGKDHPSGPGQSPMTEHLRSRLKGLGLSPHAIEFPGPADRTALPTVYAGAAVVVIPSLWENFPYTCLEAMAAGRAVVASAVGGIPEIITHEADGLLVPAGSPEALAVAARRLLGDADLRRRLGRRARLTVIERFAPEPVCGATLRAYESVL